MRGERERAEGGTAVASCCCSLPFKCDSSNVETQNIFATPILEKKLHQLGNVSKGVGTPPHEFTGLFCRKGASI